MNQPSIEEQVELLMRGTEFADEIGLKEKERAENKQTLRFQMASELKKALIRSQETGKPLRVYQGFDPTASSLHIGHMVAALKLRQFQQLGHQVIFLIGDYTAMIGDPSGQSSERKQLTHEEVLQHAQFYTTQAFHLLDSSQTEIRQNGEWLSKLTFADIAQLASFFPLKQIIARRDFQQRLENGDSLRFHECLYSLMQGYDAHALACDVQIGGYDQHFNMLAGRIIQQKFNRTPHVMLTMPLLLGTDGRKMSKSYGNAIMLDESPADIFGKCMRISDDLIPQYLELATTLTPQEINRHKEAFFSHTTNPKNIKKVIGRNIVCQYHDPSEADHAEEIFRQMSELRKAPKDVAKTEIEVGQSGLGLPKMLAQLGMVKSNSDGRRMIKQGAVSIDDEKICDVELSIPPGRNILIRVGKRRYLQVKTR